MSRLRSLVALVCALCLLTAAFSPAWADDLTLDEERKIGEEAFLEITASLPLVEDPDCVAYMRYLGAKLAKEFTDNPFTFRFYIADVSEFNALALPGGWMIFFRGLITTLKSEGELAGGGGPRDVPRVLPAHQQAHPEIRPGHRRHHRRHAGRGASGHFGRLPRAGPGG